MRLRGVGIALALMGAIVAGACTDSLIGPAPATDNGALFDEVWHEFDLHYSFFDLKHINWDSLGESYRPQALAASPGPQLASVLARMLGELQDVHVSITPTGSEGTMRYTSALDTIPTYFDPTLVTREYLPAASTTSGGHVIFGMLSATVGYMRVPSFDGDSWDSEVDDALGRMPNATRMVVDVRGNLGGKYALAAAVAGRFADRSHTFGYVRYRNGPQHSDFTDYNDETVTPTGPRQFTGPVYVLTNRRSVSSAEDFVLAMTSLPSTTVVGDTTAGASGGPIVRDLPNGWTYQLSEWIEYTRDKQTFEGHGLAPTVVVKASVTDLEHSVDAVLEQALTLARR